jgi:GAF domain-containing protein
MDTDASDLPRANTSRRMWTERDDDLPDSMAEMLASAIAADMLETTRAYWQIGIGGDIQPVSQRRDDGEVARRRRSRIAGHESADVRNAIKRSGQPNPLNSPRA